jgi:predicted RNase H-like nuclease
MAQAVLGIDAAWTAHNPSGVAVAVNGGHGWTVKAVAPSYEQFYAQAAGLNSSAKPTGGLPSAARMLSAASSLCGTKIDLVAIDMPLSHTPIVGRRTSDTLISKVFGGRKCGTHSPSSLRPGLISDNIKTEFETEGFPLRTLSASLGGLVEVYPHPALLHLMAAPFRLPYKMSKTLTYWPDADKMNRRKLLLRQWQGIAARLETQISGVQAVLPQIGAQTIGVQLKAYEDMLDAIICVWIGICALEGRATGYGDDTSAIWVPDLVPANPVDGVVASR